MKRRTFIQTTTLAGFGIATSKGWSWPLLNPTYTRDQLIGKGNPEFKGDGFKMHPEAFDSYQRMKTQAATQGIAIEMVSAYRSFQRQKEIFEGKYRRFTGQGLSPIAAIEKIIEYSTIPGTSRHHWGTDIDIIDANGRPRPESVLQERHFHGKGAFCKLKEWLDEHAEDFGFYEVYTDLPGRMGFKYEPWHFSYAPVSKPMLQEYRKLDIKQVLQEEKIAGSEHFTDDFINRYRSQNILDINPKLL